MTWGCKSRQIDGHEQRRAGPPQSTLPTTQIEYADSLWPPRSRGACKTKHGKPTTPHDARPTRGRVLACVCGADHDLRSEWEVVIGARFHATCRGCGRSFTYYMGGGFAFHLLRCDRCGREKSLRFRRLDETHLRYLKGIAPMPWSIPTAEHNRWVQEHCTGYLSPRPSTTSPSRLEPGGTAAAVCFGWMPHHSHGLQVARPRHEGLFSATTRTWRRGAITSQSKRVRLCHQYQPGNSQDLARATASRARQ